jgi:hypothetical protein
VIRDEESVERAGVEAGGGLLEWAEKGRIEKSWQVMPQVKELKRRKLKAAGRRLKGTTADMAAF